MISLDQVYLLEQKVESAVEKIQQLQAENDALRNKCTELTNALSAKSEQLSSFESDQSQIENGIKKALDRLNSIENAVLKNASQADKTVQAAPVTNAQPQAPVEPQPAPVQQSPAPQAEEQKPTAPVQSAPSFDTMDTVPQTNEAPAENTQDTPEQIFDDPMETPEDDDNHDGLGFDIF